MRVKMRNLLRFQQAVSRLATNIHEVAEAVRDLELDLDGGDLELDLDDGDLDRLFEESREDRIEAAIRPKPVSRGRGDG